MNRAEAHYEFASHFLPGGVCASARANAAIGHPFYVSRGDGAMLYDLDGRAYMDLCTSHLCVLEKAFGGGMPISALAGSRTVMQHLKPLGNSQMSGTYLAHPTGVAAALAALEACFSSPRPTMDFRPRTPSSTWTRCGWPSKARCPTFGARRPAHELPAWCFVA